MAERDGGFLRDSRGRRILKNVPADTPPATSDILMAGTLVDSEGREIVTIANASGATGTPVSAADYAGLDPTGTEITANTAALRSAVADARSEGRPLSVPKGRYRLSGTLTQSGQTGPLVVLGAGVGETVFVHEYGTAVAPAVFEHGGGAIGSPVLVTANIAAGAETITVASTTGLAAGDFLCLRDLANVHYGTSPNQGVGREGEVVRVLSVDSATQITLWGATEESYTLFTGTVTTTTGGATESFTNNNVDIRKLTLIQGHRFENFTIESAHDPADANLSTRGFMGVFSFSRGFRASNIHLKNIRSDGWRGEFATEFLIDRCSSEGGHVDAHYMVQVRQGSSGIVANCSMYEGRHLLTTGDGATDIPPRHVLVAHCKTYGTRAAAFDTHGNGKHITFLHPEVNGPTDVDAGGGNTGIQIRCKDATVIEPKVNGRPFYGVAFYAGATNGRLVGGDIRASSIPLFIQRAENIKVEGVRLWAPPGGADTIRIERQDSYNVAMENLSLSDIEIIGVAGSPVTNGVNYVTHRAGFRHENVRGRNVTNLVAGATQRTTEQWRHAAPHLLRGLPYHVPVITGNWYSSVGGTETNQTMTAGFILGTPLWLPDEQVITALAINITTAAAGATVRLGVYLSTSEGVPGTLLLDAGTVDGATTGAKEIDVSAFALASRTLPAGLVWLSSLAVGANVAATSFSSGANFGRSTSTAALVAKPGMQSSGSQTTFPTTWPGTPSGVLPAPKLAWKAA